MFLERYFIEFDDNVEICKIPNYNRLITNFINTYIKKYCLNKENEEDIKNAIIYSKYYLYYKTLNCIYDKEIMDILYFCDFLHP
jgi:hypothetical protein